MSALTGIVDDVERQLAAFYGFPVVSSASSHLVTKDELRQSLGPSAESHPEWHARGGVWMLDEAGGEVFIGIHIADDVRATLDGADPTRVLKSDNLDAYCVVIEEISHFHLILNRALAARNVSRLELEYQGEIDKLLVCAMTLGRQAGDPHLLPLARLLYDQATIVGADHERYWEATRHAARFWYEALRANDTLTTALREELVARYYAPFSEKLASLPRAS